MEETKLESDFVHKVYDNIAVHFSSTRYKAWPIVDRFIKETQKYSLGIDIGCGNGKNMLIRNDIWINGFDL